MLDCDVPESEQALVQTLSDDLARQYGPVLPSACLAQVFCYPSAEASRQAVSRGTVPVPLFRIPNRRGWFALARDVATWLYRQRSNVTQRDCPNKGRTRQRSAAEVEA